MSTNATIITDHLGDQPTRVLASGTTVVLNPDGTVIARLVCGEIVPVHTEDGITSGRCSQPVLDNDLACPGHAELLRVWRGQSEAEVLAWEHEQERVAA